MRHHFSTASFQALIGQFFKSHFVTIKRGSLWNTWKHVRVKGKDYFLVTLISRLALPKAQTAFQRHLLAPFSSEQLMYNMIQLLNDLKYGPKKMKLPSPYGPLTLHKQVLVCASEGDNYALRAYHSGFQPVVCGPPEGCRLYLRFPTGSTLPFEML